jgi:hypothetical protein
LLLEVTVVVVAVCAIIPAQENKNSENVIRSLNP